MVRAPSGVLLAHLCLLISLWETFALPKRPVEQQQRQHCGQSGMIDWGWNIPAWKEAHPGVDGFCYFENLAPWFKGISSITNYSVYGRAAAVGIRKTICPYLGEGKGPIVNFTFDMGTLNLQLDHCSNRQDDPYCYSFGWLKNQGLDAAMMRNNYTAWKELGEAECERLQDKYRMLDEEVIVGRHVYDNIFLYRKTLCAIEGDCQRPTARDFAVHVYTKCQLGGNAAMEMAYCYNRGCLLPGNRIRHGSECGDLP
mmetsp:Transcript_40652/g.81914  ORF Transcript_40652/g.81914 Transcript_40652/m.81914 type:complete len:255 (-) Transcript_40652:388-1152(-)